MKTILITTATLAALLGSTATFAQPATPRPRPTPAPAPAATGLKADVVYFGTCAANCLARPEHRAALPNCYVAIKENGTGLKIHCDEPVSAAAKQSADACDKEAAAKVKEKFAKKWTPPR